MKSKISKIIMTLSLVFCMAISMFSINVNAADSTSISKIDDCERVVKAYDAEKAATYIAGDNTYPTLDGYLFSGWYTAEACDKDCVLNGEEPSGTVYALFVPEHVLSIKAQLSAHVIDNDVTNDATASIRFVTTVDSLLYKQVGFEISYVGSDGNVKTATSASNTVYSKLYQTDSTSEVWEVTPEGTFCGVSRYFKACTVKNVPTDNYVTEFTVKPFWVTMDGDKVYGAEATKTIEEGCLRDEVYVDATNGQDIPYYGSQANPYKTFDYAMTHVKDSGKVNLVGEIQTAGEGETGWKAHGKKNVTITGGTLDVTTDDLFIKDGVIFSNMTLKIAATDARDFNRIFAEGNDVTIASDVTVSNQEATVQIFGGGATTEVESTNLKIHAGTYSIICGGGSGAGAPVTKDTNLIVGGAVSADIIFGGGYSGAVQGNTNLTVSGTVTADEMYGGGNSGSVQGNTNIHASGAVDIVKIHGGGCTGNVQGNVNITAGSGMNPNADYTSHDYTYLLNGGCHSGIVYGDVNIDVQEGATFNYIHGGVGGAADNMVGVVKGSIDIKFAGKTYGLYGGSLNGTNADTHIRVVGGEVYQIFGGTRKLTMEGNTDVRIEGGIVHRRIYGGSYNNWSLTWESPSRQVKGYASVTISSATGVNLNQEDDNALSALSRYGSAQADEWGVLIFEDGLYDTYKSKIKGALESTSNPSYHYLVKATTGGEVHAAGEYLNIKPDSGYVATVTIGGVEKHYTESDSYYKLPTLNSSTDEMEIIVTFGTEKKTDFSNYEAKIGGVYYITLEEALAVLDKYEDAELEDIGAAKRLIKVTVKGTEFGTITADKEYCLVENNETITIKEKELLNTDYYLAGLKINDDEVSLNLDGTYSLTPSVGGEYVVTAVHKKLIFEPKSPWILVNQHQSTDEKGVKSGTITLPSGGYGMLYLYRTTDADGNKGYDYENVDYTLKLKDWGGTDSATPYTMFEFIFNTDSGEKVYQIRVEETDGGVQIRNNSNSLVSGSEVYYTLSDAEYTLYKGNGVDVRVLREGTKISLYVNDEFKKSIYLPEPLENDDMTRVRLQRDGDSDVQVDIQFKLDLPEKESMVGKYVSIIGDGISMSTGIPTNADGTSTADNNSTTATNNATGIYGNTIDQGIGSDWTKLYWGQSLVTNGMNLLVNNSISEGTTVSTGVARGSQLHADSGTLNETNPDIIYLFIGTEDRKQTGCSGFEASYRETLTAITNAYPEAEVFCFTTMAFYNEDHGLMSSTSGTASAKTRMPLVNNAIIKVTGEFENATLVDIKDIITTENYKTYFPSTDTMITPHVDAHTEIAALLQKALESQFTSPVHIAFEEGEYGTPTADKIYCNVGDTVVIKDNELLSSGYYLTGLLINGEEVALSEDGTYSLTTTQKTYVVKGIYKKEIFEPRDPWVLRNQNQGTDENGVTSGTVTLPSGGYGMLYLYRTTDADGNKGYDYENVDYTLTLKDWGGTDSATPYTMFEFIFNTDSGEKVYQIRVEETDGGVQIRNNSNSLVSGSEVYYTFSDAEYTLYTGEGVDVRVLREGTKISLYVNNEFKKSIYLPEPLENDDMARVRLQRDGDSNVQVDVPFKLALPEKESMDGKYVSILGDGISMSAGIPTNADGTSTADNNSTISVNNATDIYGADIDQGIGSDWTKLYWGQSLVTNGMNLLVNNSISKGLLHANPHVNTYGNDASQLVHYVPGYQRAGELDADQGTLAGITPDIIYVYMGTEDRKQSDPAGFEAKYKATLDTVTATYPNAEVFCFTTMAYFDGGGYRGIGYTDGSSAARMKTVNDAVKKLACQYENVTLVDIADIITMDNYKTYFPETVTRVAPNNLAHDEIAALLQKALESQFKAPVTTE